MKILHLSDIHFGRNYTRTKITDPFEKRNEIMDGLLNCIGSIPEGQKPEHIVVTGDIAWFGKRDEYDEAKTWFLRLLEVTGLTGKDLTFCVGNHDVNWSYGKIIDTLSDKTIKEIDEAYEYKNVCDYEAPIQEYEQFCQDLGVEPYKYYVGGKVEYSYSVGHKDVLFPSRNIIRFIGFNTAMLSHGKNISEEKMWIGQAQIRELMAYGILPRGNDCKYSIALMHHAERFLHPNEICEYDNRSATLPLLMKNVDLVLCGHTETGGVPVLRTQEGGGRILTAGATYYNDEHPNSFSILYIPDEGKGIAMGLYLYNGKWEMYQHTSSIDAVKQVKEIPVLGEVEEKCEFVVIADGKKYVIPMEIISVYMYMKDGEVWCRLENNKEVTRKLEIVCHGPINGGTATANVMLPMKKKEDVSAMLEREKYFSFLQNIVAVSNVSEFYILSSSGVKILKGNNMHIEDENLTNEEGIEILEKLSMIEKYFDIRLVRPDEIYESDEAKIDLLIELINNGYTEKINIGNVLDFQVQQLDWIEELYDYSCKENRIRIFHKGNYECVLFDKRIRMDDIIIISEAYKADVEDLRYKKETYREGDSRNVRLIADDDVHTYFILNDAKMNKKIQDSDCMTINIGHMGINNGFIYERA